MAGGWKIRHDLSGDVPFFAAALIVLGGVIAIVGRVVADLALNRHSKKIRTPGPHRVSHRH